jgi:hypothetical protein
MPKMKRLVDIEALASELFRQRWVTLDAAALTRSDLVYPGVYLLAFTCAKIAASTVKPDQVLYAGMSNSAGGVRSRLKQFIKGIEKNDFHSGAMRFYREQCGGNARCSRGAIRTQEADARNDTPVLKTPSQRPHPCYSDGPTRLQRETSAAIICVPRPIAVQTRQSRATGSSIARL